MMWASYSVAAAATLAGCGGRPAAPAPEVAPQTRQLIEEAEGFERQRRYDRARERYRLAIERAPEGRSAAFAAHRFASALAFWGELGPAREMLEHAVARDPARAAAWHDLGIVSEQLGDAAAAERALARALELAPGDPRPKVALAALLVKAERCAEAERLYRELLAAEPPAKVRRAIGRALEYLEAMGAEGRCRGG